MADSDRAFQAHAADTVNAGSTVWFSIKRTFMVLIFLSPVVACSKMSVCLFTNKTRTCTCPAIS